MTPWAAAHSGGRAGWTGWGHLPPPHPPSLTWEPVPDKSALRTFVWTHLIPLQGLTALEERWPNMPDKRFVGKDTEIPDSKLTLASAGLSAEEVGEKKACFRSLVFFSMLIRLQYYLSDTYSHQCFCDSRRDEKTGRPRRERHSFDNLCPSWLQGR
jgi:hypothetical protein